MVKGFTDDKGRFRPTDNNGGESSKEKSVEPEGISLRDSRRQFFTTTGIQPARLSLTEEEQEENIMRGKEIVEEFQQVLDEREDNSFDGRSIERFIEGNSQDVQDRWFENLGRDEDKFREFLDNRLEKKKGVWNLAVPISTDGLSEDSLASNYTTKSNKGRMFWGKISPEDFLALASPVGTFTEKVVESRQKQIKEGQPISTPFLDISWDKNLSKWRIRSHEGRHRAEASRREGLDEIPVWLESNEELWSMTEEQENSLIEALSGTISRFSFISENR